MPSNAHYRYPDGSEYIGEWNDDGQKEGKGVMTLPDGSKYAGFFENGLSSGVGVIHFKDGSRYEGEFAMGKFAGHGIFSRADGMRFEGEFKDGKVWGHGLLTFADGTHGLPRNEGYFEGGRLIRREKCDVTVRKAHQAADKSRAAAHN